MKPIVFLTPLLLTGCLTNPQQMPILTCAGECTYYGPPQRNPNVEMAEVLTGGAVKLGLGLVNGSVMKSAFDGKNSSNTIERTTNNTTTSISDRDRSASIRESTDRFESQSSTQSVTATETTTLGATP